MSAGGALPAEVLLVSTYELGHQPLGLALTAAFLERAGVTSRSLDLSIEALDESAVRGARVIAISVPMHTALRLGVRVVERVLALHPSAEIVCFGHYAPLNESYLRAHGVAHVLGGECEQELVDLVRHRSTRNEATRSLPILERLDFPTPRRADLLPLSRYARLLVDGESRVAGYTEASRGCKHMCRHCPIPPVYGGRFFVIPVETVLEDVRQLVAAGARHVTLGDPDFLNGPRHALAVLHAIHAEHPTLTLDFTAKVEHLLTQREHLAEFARAGVLFVVSAVESVNDRVLAILDKGHTRADVVTLSGLMRDAGVTLRPSLLPFTPWTGIDGYLDLLDFLEHNRMLDAVDPVQLAIRLLLPPGSLLLEHPAMRPHLGALDEAALSWTWRHPDPRVDELAAAVSLAVEQDAAANADAAHTFARIRRLAETAAGRPLTSQPPQLARTPPPRLSESWFCCAEPTRMQMGLLEGGAKI